MQDAVSALLTSPSQCEAGTPLFLFSNEQLDRPLVRLSRNATAVKLRDGEGEELCARLALGKRGQQRGNRVRGCRERESENSVATMSCIPLLAPQEIDALAVVELRSSDWRPRIDMGLRAKRNPTAIAASMFGRHDRTARVSAIHPKAAGKATLTWEGRRRDLP
jgi:hypothetical protein